MRRLLLQRSCACGAGGAAAVLAKTGAAPVERVKLLLQNQAEMLRWGALTRPYRGITDAFARVLPLAVAKILHALALQETPDLLILGKQVLKSASYEVSCSHSPCDLCIILKQLLVVVSSYA